MDGSWHEATTGRSTFQLMTDRNFGPFFFANLASNSGTWFQNIAAILLIYDLTGSSTLVGLVSALQFGFALVLSVWAGMWADRHDRKRLIISGQSLGLFAALALMYLSSRGIEVWQILGFIALAGIGHAVTSPALQASITQLVPPADVGQAVALNSVTYNLARAIGPALGAIVYVRFGPVVSFRVNATTYASLIVALTIIRLRTVQRDDAADRSLLAGVRHVLRHRTLIGCLIGVGALGFAMDPVNTLTPAMVSLFGREEQLVGFMVGTFGAGAVVSAVLVRRLRASSGRGQTGMRSLILLGAMMGLYAISPNPEVAFVALFIGGAAFLLGVSDFTALMHELLDDSIRGRVMALWGMAFLGVRPIAAIVHGAIGDLMGPRPGIGFAVVVAASAAVAVQRTVAGPRDARR
jgi:MFS family permease